MLKSFLIATAITSPFIDLPYVKDLLPKTIEQVSHATERYEHTFDALIEEFLSLLEKGDGGAAIKLWNQATTLTQVMRTQLGYLLPHALYPEMQIATISSQEYDRINAHFIKSVGNTEFKQKVEHFYDRFGKKLAPSETYFFTTLLGWEAKGTPYTFLKGEAKEKRGVYPLTVMNANVLFMPDGYPYFFGGVAPWPDRIDALCALFKEKHPDILCLQEVHEEKSAAKLYEHLKNLYPYFYLDIGQKNVTTNPDALALNSGLFVASMYPLENPQFVPYTLEGRQEGINKGYFSAKVLVNRKPFCILYNTHLNPFDTPTAIKVREEEAQLLIESMQGGALPILLVGDLNLSWGSEEWKHSSLKKEFINAYPTSAGPTCTDYFNDLVWSAPRERRFVVKENYIYDYALIYKENPLMIQSSQVPLYDLDKPSEALSDHQAIWSSLSINEPKLLPIITPSLE